LIEDASGNVNVSCVLKRSVGPGISDPTHSTLVRVFTPVDAYEWTGMVLGFDPGFCCVPGCWIRVSGLNKRVRSRWLLLDPTPLTMNSVTHR
jgi:hypothetical protein